MSRLGEEIREKLEHLLDDELPESVIELDDNSLVIIDQLLNKVLEKERAGFDRFFESISQTLKYIPNFIVLAITNKYIEPPIAARITSKLPLKSAVSIAKGLSARYIGETARYMESDYAAELLGKLPKKLAREVLSYSFQHHGLSLLDILAFSEGAMVKLARAEASGLDDLAHLEMSEQRRRVLNDLLNSC